MRMPAFMSVYHIHVPMEVREDIDSLRTGEMEDFEPPCECV